MSNSSSNTLVSDAILSRLVLKKEKYVKVNKSKKI